MGGAQWGEQACGEWDAVWEEHFGVSEHARRWGVAWEERCGVSEHAESGGDGGAVCRVMGQAGIHILWGGRASG